MDKILEKSCLNCLHKWVFFAFDPCSGCWNTDDLPNWEPKAGEKSQENGNEEESGGC